MKTNHFDEAKTVVKFYFDRVYPFGAGSAYMTGTIDNDSRLELAKECAIFHITSILENCPTQPTTADNEIHESLEFAEGFWNNALLDIQKIEVVDMN